MEVSRALAKQPFEARQVELGPASLHVNWRALQHWNIAEDLVPPGVAIEFRPPSLWTQNRTLISVIIGALLLQAICISLLILELARRRAIERNLQESESRFRTMADTAPIMISMGGPDARLTFVNKTYLDFTGRTLEQEVAQDCGVGVHPEDLNGEWRRTSLHAQSGAYLRRNAGCAGTMANTAGSIAAACPATRPRRVLEVAVHRHPDLAARAHEACVHRRMLAEVALEANRPHALVGVVEPFELGKRAVDRPIVDEDQLERARGLVERCGRPRVELAPSRGASL